ncbi:hypothetical protein D3C76_1743560 [compost metagenome]
MGLHVLKRLPDRFADRLHVLGRLDQLVIDDPLNSADPVTMLASLQSLLYGFNQLVLADRLQ